MYILCCQFVQTVASSAAVFVDASLPWCTKCAFTRKAFTSAARQLGGRCVAGCCRVLQGVAGCCRLLVCVAQNARNGLHLCCSPVRQQVCCRVLQNVAGCCKRLQGVAGCCRVLQGAAGCCRVLQGIAEGCCVCCTTCTFTCEAFTFTARQLGGRCVAGCCGVLQGIAGCCRVLQGFSVCCREHNYSNDYSAFQKCSQLDDTYDERKMICGVLHGVAGYCRVLQWVTECTSIEWTIEMIVPLYRNFLSCTIHMTKDIVSVG